MNSFTFLNVRTHSPGHASWPDTLGFSGIHYYTKAFSWRTQVPGKPLKILEEEMLIFALALAIDKVDELQL